MKTPITAAADDYQIRSVAQKLERDRAALMEALDGVMKHYRNIAGDCDDRDQAGEEIASLANAESTLAAARANFPEQP